MTYWHGEQDPKLSHKECKLKAEGFAEGIIALPTGKMNLQGMWKDYKELDESAETESDDD